VPDQQKRVNKRLLQGERSREEILDAAIRVMSERGFEATSVADIARESGLPNSSIYWHFNSKAGILAAVMERGAERFFASSENPPPEPDESPAIYLRRALRAASETFTEHPQFLRLFVFLLLSNDSREVVEIVDRVRDHGRANLRTLIANAFRTTAPDRADFISDQTTDFALAAFDGAFLALQSASAVSHEHLMGQLADALASLGQQVLDSA
jgi:AcrR family transcriptional regulator